MAELIESATGALALTFDDVLLQPGHSEIMPAQVDISTRLTADIRLALPILSAAMDTVTESRLAIAMAQEGGIGIIHKSMTVEQQAAQVLAVKKYESGVVKDPITIEASATIRDLLDIKQQHNISGVPVLAPTRRSSSKAPTRIASGLSR